jgi:hypothetical protein
VLLRRSATSRPMCTSGTSRTAIHLRPPAPDGGGREVQRVERAERRGDGLGRAGQYRAPDEDEVHGLEPLAGRLAPGRRLLGRQRALETRAVDRAQGHSTARSSLETRPSQDISTASEAAPARSAQRSTGCCLSVPGNPRGSRSPAPASRAARASAPGCPAPSATFARGTARPRYDAPAVMPRGGRPRPGPARHACPSSRVGSAAGSGRPLRGGLP